jgi:hypothetical protein
LKKKLDGTFRAFEVRRTVADVVLFVVYLGVGREHHACTFEALHEAFVRKQRYKDLTLEDFEILMTQVNGRKKFPWTIEIKDGVIAVH